MNNIQNNKIEKYIELLFKYNNEVNLMSRKLKYSDVKNIINESFLFSKYIDYNNIIDAGSGNGLVGIPLSIMNEEKIITLVETRKKKNIYLNKFIEEIGLENVFLFDGGIKNYFNKYKKIKNSCLVSRGFPNNYDLVDFLKNCFVKQVVLMTIEDKLKKIDFAIDNIKKNVYNINSKDILKIIKLEKVPRET